MQPDGHIFLEHLAGFPKHSFEGRFLEASICLRLGNRLKAGELNLLYEAALYASFCNIAFNGLSPGRGAIRADQEANRTGLELQFMAARERLRSSSGWQTLTEWQQEGIERELLSVVVDETNLGA